MQWPTRNSKVFSCPCPLRGAIDYEALEATVDFYLAAGIDGLFVLGTHGQGMVLEVDERKKVAARGRIQLLDSAGDILLRYFLREPYGSAASNDLGISKSGCRAGLRHFRTKKRPRKSMRGA